MLNPIVEKRKKDNKDNNKIKLALLHHMYVKTVQQEYIIVQRRQWLISILSINSLESSHHDNYRTNPSKLCHRLNNKIQSTLKLSID